MHLRSNWNMAWKQFCDLVQDQEEERIEFLKARMWDFTNGVSSLAMNEDESSERTRTALEQCDPKTDIRIFVQQFGTGNCIPGAFSHFLPLSDSHELTRLRQ
jgi:hypothetical protein